MSESSDVIMTIERKALEHLTQALLLLKPDPSAPPSSRESALAVTKIEEAQMWLERARYVGSH